MKITLKLEYWKSGRWLSDFNWALVLFQNPLRKKKIYKDSSEDISIVNSNFDNLLDTSQVMSGDKNVPKWRDKKSYGKVLASKSAKPHR